MIHQITIERSFIASHTIRLPNGELEPVHFHTWPVWVTVGSNALDTMGCVMDFHQLEQILAELLTSWEGRHLNQVPPFDDGEAAPSAERVAERIGQSVAAQLPTGVRLLEAAVGEAPGCIARYRPAG